MDVVALAAVYVLIGAIAIGMYILAVDAAGWPGGLVVTVAYIAFAVYVATH